MADSYTVRTDIGKIVVSNNSIREIVQAAVDKFDGRVYITNRKGRPQGRFGDEARDIDITVSEGRLRIRTYIVIRFGISIHLVTNEIAEDIKNGIETVTGQKPAVVSLVVAGVMSAKLAKRDIEVVKEYDD